MKSCIKCKKSKSLGEFKFISNKNKYNTTCVLCIRQYAREYYKNNKIKKHEYYLKNKKKISNYNKQYRLKKIDFLREQTKNYRDGHKEYYTEYAKKYYIDNKSILLDRQKSNYKLNKKEINKKSRERYQNNKSLYNKINVERVKERKKTDPVFRLRKNVSWHVYNLLKRNGGKKRLSILEYLPYSIKELKCHLESQFEPWMNWDNYGSYKVSSWNDNDVTTWTWSLDHIIPQSKLIYNSMEHPNFIKCWGLDNLRPLSSKQNLLDGVNRVRHD